VYHTTTKNLTGTENTWELVDFLLFSRRGAGVEDRLSYVQVCSLFARGEASGTCTKYLQTEPDPRRVTIFGDIDLTCYMGMYGQVKWVQVVQPNLS
jgi:hypothetical protein